MKKHRVQIAFILIGLFAFNLRMFRADVINNNIDDLSARHILMSLDAIHGKPHFPQGPWILEHDESGFSLMLVPWIVLFGKDWAAFRLFGASLSSLAPAFLFCFTSTKFGFAKGLIAGLFLATMPSQLVWDRNLIMSSIAVQTILWLASLCLITHKSSKTAILHFLAGGCIAASSYVAHYSALIFPTLLFYIFTSSESLRKRFLNIFTLLSGFMLLSFPLVLHVYKNPEYLLWRQRHFHQDLQAVSSLFANYWSAFQANLRDLVLGGKECLFLRADVPVLNHITTMFVIVGIIYLIRHSRKDFIFVFGLPITLYVLMGFIKTENWSGVYHSHAVPFFAIAAALGLCYAASIVKYFGFPYRNLFISVFIIGISVSNILSFFKGQYRIHPRPDSLTKLQADMKLVEDIPYAFSNRISEVAHYHMPFWVATRSYKKDISIFGWDNEGFLSDPDKLPIQFTVNDKANIGIVIHPGELDELKQRLDQSAIREYSLLPLSQLLIVKCQYSMPPLLKRTWTESHIPPILPIKRD